MPPTHADGVDVGHVTSEGLPAHAVPDIPQLGGRVTGPRHKGLEVRAEGQAHHVPRVARETGGHLASLDVPQSAESKSGGDGRRYECTMEMLRLEMN